MRPAHVFMHPELCVTRLALFHVSGASVDRLHAPMHFFMCLGALVQT